MIIFFIIMIVIRFILYAVNYSSKKYIESIIDLIWVIIFQLLIILMKI